MQIWPSGQASGLDPKGARGGRFDSLCISKSKCFWGGAKAFSAGKISFSQIYIGGTLDFYHCLINVNDFWVLWLYRKSKGKEG